jgi:hypothetical protein
MSGGPRPGRNLDPGERRRRPGRPYPLGAAPRGTWCPTVRECMPTRRTPTAPRLGLRPSPCAPSEQRSHQRGTLRITTEVRSGTINSKQTRVDLFQNGAAQVSKQIKVMITWVNRVAIYFWKRIKLISSVLFLVFESCEYHTRAVLGTSTPPGVTSSNPKRGSGNTSMWRWS